MNIFIEALTNREMSIVKEALELYEEKYEQSCDHKELARLCTVRGLIANFDVSAGCSLGILKL